MRRLELHIMQNDFGQTQPPHPGLLIANRGEIACSIISTVRQMNIETKVIHSDIDMHAMHVKVCQPGALGGP